MTDIGGHSYSSDVCFLPWGGWVVLRSIIWVLNFEAFCFGFLKFRGSLRCWPEFVFHLISGFHGGYSPWFILTQHLVDGAIRSLPRFPALVTEQDWSLISFSQMSLGGFLLALPFVGQVRLHAFLARISFCMVCRFFMTHGHGVSCVSGICTQTIGWCHLQPINHLIDARCC